MEYKGVKFSNVFLQHYHYRENDELTWSFDGDIEENYHIQTNKKIGGITIVSQNVLNFILGTSKASENYKLVKVSMLVYPK